MSQVWSYRYTADRDTAPSPFIPLAVLMSSQKKQESDQEQSVHFRWNSGHCFWPAVLPAVSLPSIFNLSSNSTPQRSAASGHFTPSSLFTKRFVQAKTFFHPAHWLDACCATTLKPLTDKVNSTDYIVTMAHVKGWNLSDSKWRVRWKQDNWEREK